VGAEGGCGCGDWGLPEGCLLSREVDWLPHGALALEAGSSIHLEMEPGTRSESSDRSFHSKLELARAAH
jgi:hypothetical protein